MTRFEHVFYSACIAALALAVFWEIKLDRRERVREQARLREEVKFLLDEHLMHQDVRYKRLLVAGEN